MKECALLDVGALADIEQLVVAAQHRPEPDADVAPNPHVPDHVCVGSNPDLVVGGEDGGLVVQGVNRHLSFFHKDCLSPSTRAIRLLGRRCLEHAMFRPGSTPRSLLLRSRPLASPPRCAPPPAAAGAASPGDPCAAKPAGQEDRQYAAMASLLLLSRTGRWATARPRPEGAGRQT